MTDDVIMRVGGGRDKNGDYIIEPNYVDTKKLYENLKDMDKYHYVFFDLDGDTLIAYMIESYWDEKRTILKITPDGTCYNPISRDSNDVIDFIKDGEVLESLDSFEECDPDLDKETFILNTKDMIDLCFFDVPHEFDIDINFLLWASHYIRKEVYREDVGEYDASRELSV